MGKNFDEVHLEDREFEISGQKFHWRIVGWQEQSDWIDAAVERTLAEEEKTEKARAEAEKAGKEYEGDSAPLQETMERVIDRIVHFTEKDERTRLLETLRSTEKPVSMVQLGELGNWLQEVQTERPTPPPADSSAGDGSTEVSSPDA